MINRPGLPNISSWSERIDLNGLSIGYSNKRWKKDCHSHWYEEDFHSHLYEMAIIAIIWSYKKWLSFEVKNGSKSFQCFHMKHKKSGNHPIGIKVDTIR